MTTTVERATTASDAAPVRKKKSKKFSPWGVVAWIVGARVLLPGVLDGADVVQAGE